MNDNTSKPGRPPVRNLGLICACGDVNHDHANALLAEVYTRLGMPTANFVPRVITPANFVTEVIRSLAWDLGVRITDIPSDQWFGIGFEDRDDEKGFIQCDKVEHGLAGIWKRYADAQGLNVLPPEPGDAEPAREDQ